MLGAAVRALACAGVALSCSHAQISFDGSIGGPAGALAGPAYQIPAERGEQAGANLLHSFAAFNLAGGESATFQGPAGVSNILARVTGGPSTIHGTIHSQIPGANLYLLNPAGIVFGQGAALNLSGAFHATTGDYLRLADGRLFAASGSGDFSLLTAPPEAFGFLAASGEGGAIRVEGPAGTLLSLGLDGNGHDLGFVGRSVEVNNAHLRSAGGTVAMAAAGTGAAEVPVVPPAGAAAADPALTGEVALTNPAMSVSGAAGGRVSIRGGNLVVAGAGTALVREGNASRLVRGIEADSRGAEAGRIELAASGDVTLRDGARLASVSTDDRPAGTVRVQTSRLTIDGSGAATATSLLTQASSAGSGGRIEVEVDRELEIIHGGAIEANSLGSGTAGAILVRAGSLHVAAGGAERLTGIASAATGRGAVGTVDIEVRGAARIEDRGWIAARNVGPSQEPGHLRFRADTLTVVGLAGPNGLPNSFLTGILGLVTPGAAGRGASLSVEVPGEIRLLQGGMIDASVLWNGAASTGGTGGDVSVTAGSLFVDRMGSDFFTGVGSDTEFTADSPAGDGTTNAGNVVVTAGRIELWNGGLISSSSGGSGNAGTVTVTADTILAAGRGSDTEFVFSPFSGIGAGTSQEPNKPVPRGQGGSVTVTADTISLRDSAQIASATVGPGTAGDIVIEAGLLELSSSAAVSVRAELADAGTLRVAAGDISLSDAAFTASAGGDGGSIEVTAAELLFAERARIEAEAVGDGGNILIPGGRFVVLDHSAISANAVNGDGGNIEIRAGVFLTNESSVTASSQFGADGVVRIDPLNTLSGSEGESPPPPLDLSDVLQPECTERLPTDTGSFIVAGKGGTPRQPGGYLPSLRLLGTAPADEEPAQAAAAGSRFRPRGRRP